MLGLVFPCASAMMVLSVNKMGGIRFDQRAVRPDRPHDVGLVGAVDRVADPHDSTREGRDQQIVALAAHEHVGPGVKAHRPGQSRRVEEVPPAGAGEAVLARAGGDQVLVLRRLHVGAGQGHAVLDAETGAGHGLGHVVQERVLIGQIRGGRQRIDVHPVLLVGGDAAALQVRGDLAPERRVDGNVRRHLVHRAIGAGAVNPAAVRDSGKPSDC